MAAVGESGAEPAPFSVIDPPLTTVDQAITLLTGREADLADAAEFGGKT